jgi:hypothetical protein
MGTDRPLMIDPTYWAKIDKLVIIDKEGEADSLKPYQWSRIAWDLTHWQDPYKTGLTMTEKNNMGWYGIKTRAEQSVIIGITDAYHGKRPGGWIDFQLACSRDGYHWRHVADQDTFFPLGEKGAWDAGMVLHAQAIEPPGSEKLYIYYTGSRVRHDKGEKATPDELPLYNMGLAFLRKDGYVSLERDGTAAVGVLQTKPIRFTGRHLLVNADASKGSIEVELCDPQGKPLSAFSREQAEPLTTNSLRHRAQWGDTADLSPLAGKAVVLRFHLHNAARLYSYRFGNPDPHRVPEPEP